MDQDSKKVLLIEDDEFLSQLLANKFKKVGLDFDVAPDAEKGLAKVRAGTCGLIVLDIILPGMDGYEALRQIKADRELAKIPVLILSNLGQQEEIKLGLSLGAETYLVKAQVSLDEIVGEINRILARRSG